MPRKPDAFASPAIRRFWRPSGCFSTRNHRAPSRPRQYCPRDSTASPRRSRRPLSLRRSSHRRKTHSRARSPIPSHARLGAPKLVAAYRAKNIEKLYSHQAAAAALAREGKNLVVVTPTASGKTLCYTFSQLAGLPDDAFEHDGQLTKREARAATLAALAPLTGENLWDVGAGCGSIAIEWLRAGEGCTAVAVECDPARAAIIARNASSLGVPGLHVIIGRAPEALVDLPPPDAIFVGGGIAMPGLLPALWAALRPGGRLVANVVSIEGEARLFEWQARYGGSLTRIGVSRAEAAGVHHLWRPLASVTQLSVTKPA